MSRSTQKTDRRPRSRGDTRKAAGGGRSQGRQQQQQRPEAGTGALWPVVADTLGASREWPRHNVVVVNAADAAAHLQVPLCDARELLKIGLGVAGSAPATHIQQPIVNSLWLVAAAATTTAHAATSDAAASEGRAALPLPRLVWSRTDALSPLSPTSRALVGSTPASWAAAPPPAGARWAAVATWNEGQAMVAARDVDDRRFSEPRGARGSRLRSAQLRTDTRVWLQRPPEWSEKKQSRIGGGNSHERLVVIATSGAQHTHALLDLLTLLTHAGVASPGGWRTLGMPGLAPHTHDFSGIARSPAAAPQMAAAPSSSTAAAPSPPTATTLPTRAVVPPTTVVTRSAAAPSAASRMTTTTAAVAITTTVTTTRTECKTSTTVGAVIAPTVGAATAAAAAAERMKGLTAFPASARGRGYEEGVEEEEVEDAESMPLYTYAMAFRDGLRAHDRQLKARRLAKPPALPVASASASTSSSPSSLLVVPVAVPPPAAATASAAPTALPTQASAASVGSAPKTHSTASNKPVDEKSSGLSSVPHRRSGKPADEPPLVKAAAVGESPLDKVAATLVKAAVGGVAGATKESSGGESKSTDKGAELSMAIAHTPALPVSSGSPPRTPASPPLSWADMAELEELEQLDKDKQQPRGGDAKRGWPSPLVAAASPMPKNAVAPLRPTIPVRGAVPVARGAPSRGLFSAPTRDPPTRGPTTRGLSVITRGLNVTTRDSAARGPPTRAPTARVPTARW